MKKKVFLHIGTHKTGTTSLQEFLGLNETRLQDFGVLIPVAGRLCKQSGHHNIGWELNKDSRFREGYGTLDDLCSEIGGSDSPVVVISSEGFEYLYGETGTLINLKERLFSVDCEVIVVIFFREWADYANSLYVELLKHGLDLSLHAFIERIIAEGEFTIYDNWRYCFAYDRIIQGFSKAFGEGSVLCGAYQKPIEPAFLRMIGLWGNTAGFPSQNPANQMLSCATILALIRYNRMARSLRLSDEVKMLGRREILSATQSNSSCRPLISMTTARRLTMRFHETSNWLKTEFGVSI